MGANAQTSVPAFTAGQVLTAAQMTEVNTGIPVFASATERDAAFGGTGEKTLAEGQYAFLEDTNETLVYDGSTWGAVAGGKILQVVRATDTTLRTTSSTSYVDANISVTITPTSATSTLLILWTNRTHVSGGTTRSMNVQITDSSNAALSGTEDVLVGISATAGEARDYNTLIGYAAPATTSAVTYKGRFKALAGSGSTANLNNDDTTGQMFAIEVSA